VIGLDTNIVVRYVTQDDPRQSPLATRLMEETLTVENPGFVTLVTLCEIAWVLAECYGADRERIGGVLKGLLETRQIQVQSPELAWRALRAWESGKAGFSDALTAEVASAEGAAKVVTFDKAAARLPGFELLSGSGRARCRRGRAR
jgi:predicted nucleic-acid-binding protein